ncbi:uncharacterized protein EAF01_008190 [Botrytis porri]|uniref:uncharacterized protein n=1 Tax=Botrytis porri TaxID=87229 RepID=UPI00190049E3|nr:uncharacterized protein EAF01_008190 [Botrytis porri]KAF7898977.1 hypothetical protein EAF01_008190 [Botrytis porri]
MNFAGWTHLSLYQYSIQPRDEFRRDYKQMQPSKEERSSGASNKLETSSTVYKTIGTHIT